MNLPSRIGIVGIGLLGGSIALRLKTRHCTVIGIDREPTATAFALSTGMIDAIAASFAELVNSVDALILAVPVEGVLDLLSQLCLLPAPQVERLRWVIDVASVKASICTAGRPLINFLGTHPMAGTERQGPQYADVALFERRSWIIMTGAPTELQTDVRSFISAMGACAIDLDPVEHDARVASSSHLPQTLSILLALVIDPDRLQGVHGSGLQSMLRLAASPWSMWRGVYAANAPAVAQELRDFEHRLQCFIEALELGHETVIENQFCQAQANLATLYAPKPGEELAKLAANDARVVCNPERP